MPSTTDAQLSREWLLTDGMGGFAMGTFAGAHTRRYHGLFIAATAPPVRRRLLLHAVFERLIVGSTVIELASQRFGPTLQEHPGGRAHLRAVTLIDDRTIEWRYTAALDDGEVSLTKRLTLQRESPGVRIAYSLQSNGRPVHVELRPMTPLRDFHALDRVHGRGPEHGAGPTAMADDQAFRITRDDLALRITCDGATARLDPDWWYDFAYSIERERGQDWREDVFSPGVFVLDPGPESFALDVTLETPAIHIKNGNDEPAATADGSIDRAGAAFVVRRRIDEASWGRSIIAGYPWFSDWGRDAMIALPGLLLVDRRYRAAGEVLTTFARVMRNGLIPNRFADEDGPPEYNTVDASLWFVYAAWMLARMSGERLSDELIAACRAIVTAYRNGTDFGIGVTQDGLIAAGNERTQLTWMDAARDGVVFTPRHGKAVEINALWHHALRCLADLTDNEREREELQERAGQVAIAFQMAFWWGERDCLHDCLTLETVETKPRITPGRLRLVRPGDEEHEDVLATLDWRPDERLRPNQIIAASLPYSPLTREQTAAVVRTVREVLLTPVGLRTLEPAHPDYRGRYEGDLFQRDGAYHNGTVWPWLIGPFIEAYLRAEDATNAARKQAREWLDPLLTALNGEPGSCDGFLAEVYDGEPPHRPSGCPAQAWSVAEVRRALAMIDDDRALIVTGV